MPAGIKRFFFSVMLVGSMLTVTDAFAQKERNNLLSVRGSIAVPHPLKNGAFRKSLTGIYNANVSVSIRPFSGFYAGAVYNNGLYKTAANKIAEVNTTLQVNGAGGRVGYDHYDNVFFSPSLTVGRQYGRFTGVVCVDPQETSMKFSANYIEPELNLYFIVDPNFAIGVNTSVALIDHTFDPFAVCFNQYKGYSQDELRGNSVVFNIGFSFYYGFIGGRPNNE
jgi:hypothetical protein